MIKPYNRENAVSYARRWALSANPEYYHFGGIGGDCTNFISQCLYAGGSIMNYSQNGWYYIDESKRSPSWTSVLSLQEFLLSNSNLGPFGKFEDINKLEIGDIIQLRQNVIRFNHTVIISKIENGEIYVCAHSTDELNKPLSNYYFIEARGIHIEGSRY